MTKNLLILGGCILAALIYQIIRSFFKNRISFGGTGENPMFYASADNKLINQAIEEARQTVDKVISELKTGSGVKGSVKVEVVDGNVNEYMWLADLRFEGDKFYGKIDNDPETVKNVKCGDDWQVGKNEIYDWLYQKDGKMYGNFTFKASLKKFPKEKQLVMLKGYGDCEHLADDVIKETAGPLLGAFASAKPEELIRMIKNSKVLPEDKKQEMIEKIKQKAASSNMAQQG